MLEDFRVNVFKQRLERRALATSRSVFQWGPGEQFVSSWVTTPIGQKHFTWQTTLNLKLEEWFITSVWYKKANLRDSRFRLDTRLCVCLVGLLVLCKDRSWIAKASMQTDIHFTWSLQLFMDCLCKFSEGFGHFGKWAQNVSTNPGENLTPLR